MNAHTTLPAASKSLAPDPITDTDEGATIAADAHVNIKLALAVHAAATHFFEDLLSATSLANAHQRQLADNLDWMFTLLVEKLEMASQHAERVASFLAASAGGNGGEA